MRWIPNIPADRAQLRLTLSYRVTPSFQLGIEVNPIDESVGPLANWRVIDETELRPALILGTSSDRIGTDSGQAYYATLSKNLEPLVDYPFSPYVGASINDRDGDVLPVAGLSYPIWDLHVTHLYDGRNIHLTLDYPWQRHNFGMIVAEQDGKFYLGASYGIRF